MEELVNNELVSMSPAKIAEFEAMQQALTAAPLPPTQKQMAIWVSNLLVDGDSVSTVGVDNGMAFAFFISATEIMAFFTTPAEDLSYGWNASSTIGTAHVTARDEYSLTITVADTVVPFELSVQIYRLV